MEDPPVRESSIPVGATVLVADDDPAMRDFMLHMLGSAGFTVRPAMDVPEAIERLRDPGVVAAVVDMLFVNSNGLSGLDVLRYIRSRAHLRDIPVIVLTGFSLSRPVVAAIHGLGAELWTKPADIDALVRRLRERIFIPALAGPQRVDQSRASLGA
jgi:CheY-like chemotaxis protein